MKLSLPLILVCPLLAIAGFSAVAKPAGAHAALPDPDARNDALRPRVVTEPTKHDTDDPAIWINRADPAQSLIIGTDKSDDGALYVFGLDGKIQWDKCVRGLLRPNNCDIARDVPLGAGRVDIVGVTERHAHRLRLYRLPEMSAIDGGGIPVFEGEAARECMGIAFYTRPSDGALFVIVSRAPKGAPHEGYLQQLRITEDGHGGLRGTKVRNFGTWSGRKEIEAVAVDDELGYVYYADERYGVHKWPADPDAPEAGRELALFATSGFAEDHEGISIYRKPGAPGTGYVLVSNQSADTFRIFPREGTAGRPHDHPLLASVRVSTRESDGSDVTSTELPGFPGGLFVAMSTDRTFHLYAWDDLAAAAHLH